MDPPTLIECVEIQFVTGENPNNVLHYDSRRFANPFFGPVAIVASAEQHRFIAAVTSHLEQTGKSARVQQVRISWTAPRATGRVTRGAERIAEFCAYLDEDTNW
ncbi:MAG: hypothetical protein HY369_01395 [Candidatus Aenigmarchaeota archaeon]|nr:hypothetical protein [Candidatus Aenigmarchaeota archaeon]